MNNSFDTLNKEDTYSMMLMLLYASTDNPRYSTLSELSYILDHDNFIRFIKYYEGQTIEVPKLNSMIDSLRVLMLYQYYKIENLSWHESLSKAGFELSETISARHKLDKFINQLKKYNYRLGGLMND